MPSTRILGAAGEAAAERWLRGAGLTIVAKGFRVRCGEIDLVARDGGVVVFVEVKTRIARAASVFLARAGWTEHPCRFDVLEVAPIGSGWRVTHLADAFRPGD